ncbi:Protein of unknown function DUF2079, membrane [Actinobacteria bacterium OK074]|nr:Protein of unknown function DUF2079, membrane [Actinobacteria bacterium OK074]
MSGAPTPIPAPAQESPAIPPQVQAQAAHPPPATPNPATPWYLATLLFFAYAADSLARYDHLATRSWDLGIFEQVVRAYAHGQAPIADLKGPGFNILGDHFSPILAVLAPVYRVFPSPLTLLLAQAALFALSAVPVTRAASRLLGVRRGVALGVAYGLSWGMQRAVDFDFHEIAFAVPLIAFALEAVLARRWRAALLHALPLVLVKEDLGFTAATIAVLVVVRARRTSPRTSPRAVPYAIAVASFAVVAALLTFFVLIPAFNSSGGYDYWSKMHESGAGPFDGMDTKIRTLLWILVPTSGLLALRSPLLLVALPTLGWRFLSSEPNYWGTDYHYSAVLMPVVFLALADALTRARLSPRPWLRSYAHHLPAAVLAAALALTTTLPLSALTEAEAYRKPARTTAIEGMLDEVPDGASVEANIGPIARLTSRCQVFWVGDTGTLVPDYIALDNADSHIKNVQQYAVQLHPNTRWAVVGATQGWVLLRHRAATTT